MLKKTLVGMIAGFLAAELFVRALSPLLGQPLEYYEPVAQAKVTQLQALATKGQSIDVLFVGSSTVLEGVDMAAFEDSTQQNIAAYNAALNAADTHIVRRYLLEEVLPIVEPRTVVYGISPGSFVTGSEPQIARYDSAPATSIKEPSAVERLAANLYMYRHRNTLREPLTINTILRSIRARDTNQGIVERFITDLTARGDTTNRTETSGPNSPIEVPDWRQAEPQVVPDHSVADLTMMTEELQDRDIDLVFVLMPAATFDPSFLAAVKESADDQGLDVIDATSAISTTAYFYDGVHLNAEGAHLLGSFLGRSLSKHL